ncbi:hypothetical protein [uncultured Rhodoferax sp.]|uniref:hypothetical protein n=1 Tax=uncultured Rhodoferax sp. TaxID=223188 RepID=UPI0025F52CA0|nr:hypothetical protein [uncultured Rhodoferax sp.]
MEIIFNVLRRLFKLALVIWVGMLALSILLAVLTAVAANVLWSLLRGRKPALFTTYTRFRQASQQFRGGGWNRAEGFARPVAEDVVDVQANEVREAVLPLPPSASDKS